MKAKYSRLFEVCPQLTEEIEALLSSTDRVRDWPHVVKEQLKTSKEMSVALDVYEKWIQTDKAGIDSGFFDVGKWGNLLRSVSFSDPSHMSKGFAEIQDIAVTAFKAKAKVEREAQRVINDAQAKIDAAKAIDDEDRRQIIEYETKVDLIDALGFRHYFWRVCALVNLIAMTLSLLRLMKEHQDNLAGFIWLCTLLVAICLFFSRKLAPLGDCRPLPAIEIGAWFTALIAVLISERYAFVVHAPLVVLMGVIACGLAWHVVTDRKRIHRQRLDWEYSRVIAASERNTRRGRNA